jgi:hypothetical protein
MDAAVKKMPWELDRGNFVDLYVQSFSVPLAAYLSCSIWNRTQDVNDWRGWIPPRADCGDPRRRNLRVGLDQQVPACFYALSINVNQTTVVWML